MKKTISELSSSHSRTKAYSTIADTKQSLPTIDYLKAHEYCSSTVCSVLKTTLSSYTGTQERLAIDTIHIAIQKYERLDRNTGSNMSVKTAVLINCLNHASIQTDSDLRELWGNLIANELHSASVHPECVNLISRLTLVDLFTLWNIAAKHSNDAFQIMGDAIKMSIKDDEQITDRFHEISPFSCEILCSLNLIKKELGEWELTLMGGEMLKAISEPLVVHATNEENTQ